MNSADDDTKDGSGTFSANENQPLLSQSVSTYSGDPAVSLPAHLPTANHSYAGIDQEATIGEQSQKAPKKMKTHFKLLVYFSTLIALFVTVFITFNIILIYPQTEHLINQSSEFQIENVSLDHVTTAGVQLRVQGFNFIDYDNIDDDYISKMFKLGGEVFNEVIIGLQSVKLETTLDDKLISIGDVQIPEFKVKIKDKTATDLDFIISIHPHTLKILKLLKYVFDHPDEMLKIYGDTEVKVKLGGLYLGKYAVKFSHDIISGQYFKLDLNELSMNNIRLNKDKQGRSPDLLYNLDFQLSLPNPILNNMISFNVPHLDWLLYVGDCDQVTNIPVFADNVIETGEFKLSSHEELLTVNISTSWDKLSDDLLKECKSDDDVEGTVTPIKILMDHVLNNKSIPLKIKNKGGSENYPSVVNDLLTNMDFNIDYNPNFETSQLIHNVSIDNLGFEFENGDVNNPIINGNINIFIKTPVSGLTVDDLKIPKIKGLSKLLHQNMEFAEIPLDAWHECSNEVVHEVDSDENVNEYFHIQFKIYREKVVIKDKQMFGKVINEIIYHGKSKILIDCLLDLVLNISVFENRDVIVNNVHVKSESEVTRGYLF